MSYFDTKRLLVIVVASAIFSMSIDCSTDKPAAGGNSEWQDLMIRREMLSMQQEQETRRRAQKTSVKEMSIVAQGLEHENSLLSYLHAATSEAGPLASADLIREKIRAKNTVQPLAFEKFFTQYASVDPVFQSTLFSAWIVKKHAENQAKIDKINEDEATLALQGATTSSSDSGLTAQAAVTGFAGVRNNYLFQNMQATSLGEGILAGLTYRTMFVLGQKYEDAISNEGGQIVGGLFRTIRDGIFGFRYWLFNGGIHPYTIDQIGYWKQEALKVILGGLETAAKKAQSGQADGFGARPRQNKFDALTMMSDEENEEDDLVSDATWLKMVAGFASDLDRLTYRIELPKLHYSPGDEADEKKMFVDGRADILDMATRIQEMLQLIKQHILLPTRTLKDLAAGDLKFIFPRLIDELSERFALFESMVRNYHGTQARTGSAAVDTSSKSSQRVGSGLGGYGSDYDSPLGRI
ncbi:MAG: hypothetical protein QG604_322 [Candidatus Dependentiae bacterium]|nr:hypothetical protein [Candidatus Dependentiae bacterium]